MEIRVTIRVWEVDTIRMSNGKGKFVGETIFNLTIAEVPFYIYKSHQQISQFTNLTYAYLLCKISVICSVATKYLKKYLVRVLFNYFKKYLVRVL